MEFFETLELHLYDLNFQLRGERSIEDSDIVIVAIDQETTDSLSFPFDRLHYADLARRLHKHGASLIVFDIGFSSRGVIPGSDSLFYAAIEEAGNVVLAGKISERHHKRIKHSIKEVNPPSPSMSPRETPWGLTNELVDIDAVTRRYPLYLLAGETAYLSLGLKVYSVENEFGEQLFTLNENREFEYGDLTIPLKNPNSILLNYYGPAGTFPTYSFIDVIQGAYAFDDMLDELSPEERELLAATGLMDVVSESPFKDKIVLIGASADDLLDNKYTPFYSSRALRLTPGVEVHANALQMFEDKTFIRPIGETWIILWVIAFSILTYVIGQYSGQWLGLSSTVGLIGLIGASGIYLFVNHGLWLQEIPLMLSVGLGYPTNLVYRFILTQQEKAMYRGMFGHYLPPKVVDQLIANPEMLQLGGVRRRMSVLFTDIAGFTTVSENLTPEELVELLTEYLTAMTNVILDYDGIIDKYEGDLVMAEWGAPIWFEEHATLCCRAALGMQAKLKELRKKWKAEGRAELYSRIGINSGDMIVGNMGSEDVFDYTVMGDAVNVASRLEEANKGYGSTIMIGSGTHEDVKGQFVIRPLDHLRVKGKNEPVEVFELLARKNSELSEAKNKALDLFSEGIILYRASDFQAAKELFAKAAEADSDDGPSQTYLKRCELYIENPPPDDWDGVWTRTEK